MRIALIGFAIIGLLAVSVFVWAPDQIERRLNPILSHAPYQPSAAASALHQRLFLADLHADSLLWGRNLLKKSARGQVDVPRLIEGNVALQGFTVVTKTPIGLNIESNAATSDNIIFLALAGRWPMRTFYSLKERALYQARRLHTMADASQGKLSIILSSSDLKSYLERRKEQPFITAGFLGIEGAHALDGDLANLDVLFNAGFRMMAPTHFFDNEVAGSAHGVKKGGLTTLGRSMVALMEAKSILVDLAHASPQTIDDVLAIAQRPVVVSHTGVKGTCDNRRNLSDDHIKAIARNGGVIGIGYWDTAVCGTDAHAIVRALRYAANLVGTPHVALGSDYDGSIPAPFDTSELVQLTGTLLDDGFTENEIELIMGGNVLRLLTENLP
ncbi:MAG: dipeptidase [Acidobacteria bacterium]|nr:dipeptidase [Acidobacteriota bacterium]MBI3657294.1 dipeptidase [Acidobacteriota bacterium]